MKDCWKDHARIAYNYAKGPFGGENHAFFEFIAKAINTIVEKRENNIGQFILKKQQDAWERIMAQLDVVKEHSCRENFENELKRIYEERKKFYD